MNTALLMKILWNFYNSPTLPWVQLLIQKHYRRMVPSLGDSKPNGCCPIWRGVLDVAAPFLASVDFHLGNGLTTLFWNARWYGGLTPRSRFPNLFTAANQNHKYLSVSYWYGRFANRAYLGFTALLGLLEHVEVQHLTSMLRSTPLSADSDDCPSW